MSRSRVWGWTCPWSGDEHDPIPRAYWLWYRLYRANQRVRHRFGLHGWRQRWDSLHCDWCGKDLS